MIHVVQGVPVSTVGPSEGGGVELTDDEIDLLAATAANWPGFVARTNALCDVVEGMLAARVGALTAEVAAAGDAAHIATFDPPTVLALLAEVDDLRSTVARVEALHRPGPAGWDGAYCVACLAESWPCPTSAALASPTPDPEAQGDDRC